MHTGLSGSSELWRTGIFVIDYEDLREYDIQVDDQPF